MLVLILVNVCVIKNVNCKVRERIKCIIKNRANYKYAANKTIVISSVMSINTRPLNFKDINFSVHIFTFFSDCATFPISFYLKITSVKVIPFYYI